MTSDDAVWRCYDYFTVLMGLEIVPYAVRYYGMVQAVYLKDEYWR